MSYKVVIPSAGIGSRIGPYTKFMNKALVTLGDRPAICRVIEKFPESIEIVIILGYRGDQLEEILHAFYPQRKLTFVTTDKFEGRGSGLGYTLLCAEKYLQCPFVFIPNDTVITESNIDLDPQLHGNWIGYYSKSEGDGYELSAYRTLDLAEGQLQTIHPKGINSSNIYIGLCGIKDYKNFWQVMKNRQDAITVGEALGLQALENITAVRFYDWLDCGNLKALSRAKKHYNNTEFNILDKEDEAIWFTATTVVKFSANQNFISDRLRRLEYLPDEFLPRLINSGKYFYQYEYVHGECLSNCTTNRRFYQLLDTCKEKMWDVAIEKEDNLVDYTLDFYERKSKERLQHYLNRFEQTEKDEYINGVETPTIQELLEKINWNNLVKRSKFGLFHGDLHGENILIQNKKICFIDWRQNFGPGNYKYGDIYYDLGKLLHGLIVNHGIIDQGLFSIELQGREITIDIHRKQSLVDAELLFQQWCKKNGYEWQQVKLICSLVFVNICGLHDWPYANFLYYLGRKMLHDVLVTSDFNG